MSESMDNLEDNSSHQEANDSIPQPPLGENVPSTNTANAGEVPQASPAGSAHTDSSTDPNGQAASDHSDAACSEAEDMSTFEDGIEDSDLAKAMAKIGELEDALAHSRAESYNLNQEYGNYVRRSKKAETQGRVEGQSDVLVSLMSVLDDIDAARHYGELEGGPFASIGEKLESGLKSGFGLERYGEPQEDFDPSLHDAVMAQQNPEVDHPVIAQVLQPGYRRGDKILRPAKVLVDNPQS